MSTWIFSIHLASVSSSIGQNLIQYICSMSSVILTKKDQSAVLKASQRVNGGIHRNKNFRAWSVKTRPRNTYADIDCSNIFILSKKKKSKNMRIGYFFTASHIYCKCTYGNLCIYVRVSIDMWICLLLLLPLTLKFVTLLVFLCFCKIASWQNITRIKYKSVDVDLFH